MLFCKVAVWAKMQKTLPLLFQVHREHLDRFNNGVEFVFDPMQQVKRDNDWKPELLNER
jgi:hypothetical protein